MCDCHLVIDCVHARARVCVCMRVCVCVCCIVHVLKHAINVFEIVEKSTYSTKHAVTRERKRERERERERERWQ